MIVRFPMYFEVVGYQEIDVPDYIDPDDEESIKQYIDDNWDMIPLPPLGDCCEISDGCEFDWECQVEVIS